MAFPETWLRDLVMLLTAAGMIGAMVVGWVKWRLSGDFAGKAEITALAGEIGELKTKMSTVPTHEDIRRLSERLGSMEIGVASIGSDMRGMREGVSRVEHDLRLLLSHELAKQKGEAK